MEDKLFEPIEPQGNLKDRIAALLTDSLFQGRLQPGQRLNESQIARQLQVSRAPVREALQQLQEQGLIENVARRGMFVVALTEEDKQKINSIRLVLEAEALRLARARRTPELDEKVTRLVEEIERTNTFSPYDLSRLDLAMHRTIWSFTGNEFLEKVLTSLTAPLFAHGAISLMRAKQVQVVLDSHRALLDYLLGNTSETAEQVMLRHLSARYPDPVKFSSAALEISRT